MTLWHRIFIAIAVHVLMAGWLYNNIYLNEQYWQIPLVIFLMVFQVFSVATWMHKGVTHGVWRFKSKLVEHFISLHLMMTGHVYPGGPLHWAVIHRLHHDHLDNDEFDAHSPSRIGLLRAHFHLFTAIGISKMDRKIYYDLLKNYRHLWVYQQYPVLIAWSLWLLLFLLFGWEGLFILGAASCYEFHGLGVIDAYAHSKRDKTKNIPFWLWFLSLNDPEAMHHKDHHDYPYVYSFNPTWLDYTSRIMEKFEKLGIVEIKGKKFVNGKEVLREGTT